MKINRFRAWDSDREKMMFPMVLNWWQDEGTLAFPSDFVDCHAPHESTSQYLYEVELLPFIGRKDDNGKEIYEGDIVLNEDSQLGIVKYDHSKAQFYLDLFELGTTACIVSPLFVKGNIYENPELLSDNKCSD